MFTNIIKGLNTFNSHAWDYVGEAIRGSSTEIININTDRIFKEGTDNEGKLFKNKFAAYSVYSPPYEKKKKRLGLYNGHVNLKLSGEYLDSFGLKATDDVVDIDVNTKNADLDAVLATLYGANIQGLTPDEWAGVVDKFILPVLLTELNKAFK